MPVTLRRIRPEKDSAAYSIAWLWMFEQPELYAQNAGFYAFGEFCNPPFEVADFAIERDGELLAFASLIPTAKGSCRACLIAPKRPRVRAVLAALGELQRQYFEVLGFHYAFVELPAGAQFDRARRLAQMAGLRKVGADYFEVTLIDYLRLKDEPKAKADSATV